MKREKSLEDMTSKERVKKVFEHQIPDKVAVFEQLIVSKVASKILGRYAYTGGGEFARDMLEGQMEDRQDQIVKRHIEDTVELHQKLDLDIVPVGLVPPKNIDKQNLPQKIAENTYRYQDSEDKNNFSISRFSPESGQFFTVDSSSRNKGLAAIEELGKGLKETIKEPIKFKEDQWEAVDAIVEELGKEKAICISQAMGIPIQSAWLEAVLLRPDLVELHLDNALHYALTYVEEAARHGIDFINGGGDLADTKGPVYSPKIFREMVLPRFQKLVAHCHQLGLPYIFRTDGNVWPIAGDLFINSGVDGFGEIQPTAGMDLASLKEKFPNLILWGNLDCGDTLINGSEERIEKEVKECFNKGKPGGNYIFGSSNSIHWGVPAENFLLMRKAAERYRNY
ncbi:MAG: hypothetical protein COZ37_03190 [bacterium (Candidatus Ratteibacteria) CG_4_10_14_3_um_filter_41_18]|uniref:Uroporphyrinogen decarboxylase (URO-D) domain-containing protein n=3 Tax=Candidatus Ratteibacteria TaxID=2979319 RepID=A0A2M7E6Q8_9BACT|nr:MAG: hypothetical protein AUJ76_00055 [Candidatus Omnitrophica bacterium CG1_02_41_171]PIV63420.1 MAG: hypothetical protein COS11_07515 [bacterium (Candidatus Ratteibacteria) CG01_land_8_20_14_3_00_40_19]PIW74453.1 MAG: hypothetical protein CO004_00605 [bacterium (Candidatus Ratteibacteria) CG_4_8_14_3_um_filter_41_36]PIX77340.1 MAG: hypothetical protein COZ37_03190 [bacterium (Candidatus Ratteibacteria) CG_4_10_14_3_um_filter_41_18]PJA61451.1 MAG: hypothetical protein CO162_06240 [bacterium